MTTLDDQHRILQANLHTVLHGDALDSSRALDTILRGCDTDATYAWTLAQLVTVAASDMRVIYAPVIAASNGNGYLAFEELDADAHPAQVSALRIVVAEANNETADAATLIRSILDTEDSEWASSVAVCTAEMARQLHARAYGEHR